MQPSLKNSFNAQDYEKWMHNVLWFSSPVCLAFLLTLQSGNIDMAKGAAYQALLAALIDLIRKFRQGE